MAIPKKQQEYSIKQKGHTLGRHEEVYNFQKQWIFPYYRYDSQKAPKKLKIPTFPSEVGDKVLKKRGGGGRKKIGPTEDEPRKT